MKSTKVKASNNRWVMILGGLLFVILVSVYYRNNVQENEINLVGEPRSRSCGVVANVVMSNKCGYVRYSRAVVQCRGSVKKTVLRVPAGEPSNNGCMTANEWGRAAETACNSCDAFNTSVTGDPNLNPNTTVTSPENPNTTVVSEPSPTTTTVNNYATCAKAKGSRILETYPQTCVTAAGVRYTAR